MLVQQYCSLYVPQLSVSWLSRGRAAGLQRRRRPSQSCWSGRQST